MRNIYSHIPPFFMGNFDMESDMFYWGVGNEFRM